MPRNARRRRRMIEGGGTPFTAAGGLTGEFVALLLIGRERGYLTPDDLISVMESVELTPALIGAAIGRVRAEGIEWRDDIELDTGLDASLGPSAGSLVELERIDQDAAEDGDVLDGG